MTHPAQLPIDVLLKKCRVLRTRGSGPGGQHRNKVETAVVVEHLPTGLRGEASERRSQDQNRRHAIRRLRMKLAIVERRPATEGFSDAWRQRTKGGKFSANARHEDFPSLLSEALDVVYASNFDIPLAANHLGISSSQLVKFLKVEREALELVNRERETPALSKLR